VAEASGRFFHENQFFMKFCLVSSVRTVVDRVTDETDDYGRQLDLPTVIKAER
jgi:hypothetical protein